MAVRGAGSTARGAGDGWSRADDVAGTAAAGADGPATAGLTDAIAGVVVGAAVGGSATFDGPDGGGATAALVLPLAFAAGAGVGALVLPGPDVPFAAAGGATFGGSSAGVVARAEDDVAGAGAGAGTAGVSGSWRLRSRRQNCGAPPRQAA